MVWWPQLSTTPNQELPPSNGTKVNGTVVDSMKHNVGIKEATEEKKIVKRRINQLLDWSMATEKQWTNFDWKPRKIDMFGDVFRLGRFMEDNMIFRKKFTIRSYEIGEEKMASIETLMNHIQVRGGFVINGICSCFQGSYII